MEDNQTKTLHEKLENKKIFNKTNQYYWWCKSRWISLAKWKTGLLWRHQALVWAPQLKWHQVQNTLQPKSYDRLLIFVRQDRDPVFCIKGSSFLRSRNRFNFMALIVNILMLIGGVGREEEDSILSSASHDERYFVSKMENNRGSGSSSTSRRW